MTQENNTLSPLLDPTRWGLPAQAVDELPDALYRFWKRYRSRFRTRTRDQAEHARDYLSALLRMEDKRNFAEIGRTVKESGENIQHFMSNSPWLAQAVFRQVQADIAATPALRHGGALLIDESADAKAGPYSAGSARQHNGRLGKVDLCQVGVFATFVKEHLWTWVDSELFLPETWFAPQQAAQRHKAEIPDTLQFQTKVELAWQMVQRAKQNGLPIEFVACDDLYGANSQSLTRQLVSCGDASGGPDLYGRCAANYPRLPDPSILGRSGQEETQRTRAHPPACVVARAVCDGLASGSRPTDAVADAACPSY